mgnify:CR=1 FL=1
MQLERDPTDRKLHYTERFSEFMLNGGIRRLQRHGLKADGNYGKIDNLHISYDGNRIKTVLEDADPVTQPGSMDYPGKKREMAFGYNDWGALVSDESRGIKSIEYDNFGNPVKTVMSDGSYTSNVYSYSGNKLKTNHYTSPKVSVLPVNAALATAEAVTAANEVQIASLTKLEKSESRQMMQVGILYIAVLFKMAIISGKGFKK